MNKHQVLKVLKEYFGYTSFRPGQEQIIDSVLSDRDTLGVMPTGAGKSVCYQLPALMRPGMTIVISPLISLMKDQVTALVNAGIRAAYINSSLNQSQLYQVIQNCLNGVYKIVYVAPERLENELFIDTCQKIDIPLFCVDEAHCISQWGQDFRPSYLNIPEFIRKLPRRPVMCAFTATATERVRTDIKNMLELRQPYELVTGFNRENLYFEVRDPADKDADLLNIVRRYHSEGRSGIIYCSTRKAVEEICEYLNSNNIPCTRYHAGLTDAERNSNQNAFIYDRIPIITATNAFGMGIDKSNVTFVIHYNIPRDMESYYQEAGRAGRDGSPSDCILIYTPKDVHIQRFLIDKSYEESEMDEETALAKKNADIKRLNFMTGYANGSNCLRSEMLRYFGESFGEQCGNCSVCCGGGELSDVTVDCQKILSCIFRSGQRYGKAVIADILRGSMNEKITASSLDKLTTHGIMKTEDKTYIYRLCSAMLAQGILTETDEYSVLKLTPAANMVLLGKKQVMARVGAQAIRQSLPRTDEDELAARLNAVRRAIADREKTPAYTILANSVINEMAKRKPVSLNALLAVPGMTRIKADRYGSEFMYEILDFCRKKGISPDRLSTTADMLRTADTIGAAVSSLDIEPLPEACIITDLCRKIAETQEAAGGIKININNLRSIIFSVLEDNGLIETVYDAEGHIHRKVTNSSAEAGICTEQRTGRDGVPYESIVYSPEAQRMIIELIKN